MEDQEADLYHLYYKKPLMTMSMSQMMSMMMVVLLLLLRLAVGVVITGCSLLLLIRALQNLHVLGQQHTPPAEPLSDVCLFCAKASDSCKRHQGAAVYQVNDA